MNLYDYDSSLAAVYMGMEAQKITIIGLVEGNFTTVYVDVLSYISNKNLMMVHTLVVVPFTCRTAVPVAVNDSESHNPHSDNSFYGEAETNNLTNT
jgi:hypothetical protein